MRRYILIAGLHCLVGLGVAPVQAQEAAGTFEYQANPLIRDRFTADPAPLVVGDTLYLYVGHDEARGEEMFNITEWLAYSTKDMRTWTEHGPIMRPTDFAWAQKDAWASQVHEKDGRYWFYTAVEHDPATSHGKAIGVAVADNRSVHFAMPEEVPSSRTRTLRALTTGTISIRPCGPNRMGRAGSSGATPIVTWPGSRMTW